MKKPQIIEPGETFEFRLKGIGIWTYTKDGDLPSRGMIIIKRLPEELKSKLPEGY